MEYNPNNENATIQIFMPVNMPIAVLDNSKGMKYLKNSFDTSDVLLCYCGKCVNLYLLLNNYVNLLRFNRAFITKLSKNIKNNKHRQELLGHYAIIGTKEGIIKDMVTNNGNLALTCPVCLQSYFEDHLSAMHDLNKDVIVTNDVSEFTMTRELCEAELRLIDELFSPMFRGYTTPESIKKGLVSMDSDNPAVNDNNNNNNNHVG